MVITLISYVIVPAILIIMIIIAHYINDEKHLLLKAIVYYIIAVILIKGTILKYGGTQKSFIYPLMDIVSNVFLSIIALDEALIALDKKYPNINIIISLKNIAQHIIAIIKNRIKK